MWPKLLGLTQKRLFLSLSLSKLASRELCSVLTLSKEFLWQPSAPWVWLWNSQIFSVSCDVLRVFRAPNWAVVAMESLVKSIVVPVGATKTSEFSQCCIQKRRSIRLSGHVTTRKLIANEIRRSLLSSSSPWTPMKLNLCAIRVCTNGAQRHSALKVRAKGMDSFSTLEISLEMAPNYWVCS